MNPSIDQEAPRAERRDSMNSWPQEQMLPSFMRNEAVSVDDPALFARRVIGGVMRNAQNGELPLFAWTLGLPQAELLEVVVRHFPELGALELMVEAEYTVILRSMPPRFDEMVDLLTSHGATNAQALHLGWLARALAAASMGERHLWQDLGLSNRNEVSRLLEHYFPTLHVRNTRDLKWKRFLFGELGTVLGIEDLRPPGCSKCDHVTICFTRYMEHD